MNNSVMKESQLTFSDINSPSDDELYSIISELASELTEENRSRSGDNCPTITKSTEGEDIFSVKLPPKTSKINLSEISNSYTVTVEEMSRRKTENGIFVFVAETVVQEKSISDDVHINFIFPAENPEQDGEDENRLEYDQFDFRKFLREMGYY